MAVPRRTSRSYRTELRAKQTAATRTAIVRALVAELARAQQVREELSLARVATAAGVSLRTVYHHFPDRDTQLAAVAAALETPELAPSSLAELPVFAARSAHGSLADLERLRAEVALGRPTRREHAIARAVAKQTEPAAAKLVSAGLAALLSPELVLALVDRHRLEPAQAETTLAWMVQVLVEAVRNGDVPASALKRTRRS